MGKTRPFIDKKKAVTFRLLHRSQKDPLVTDQDAPQHVLAEVQDLKEKIHEEKIKFGIYHDDGYDYMQHLKERGNGHVILAQQSIISKTKQKKGISLPSSVFQSDVEEKIGVLNKAAPEGLSLNFDSDLPEVLNAMDNASENPNDDWFDDDFVVKLNGGDLEDLQEELLDDEYDEECDEVMSLDREETKSRFTSFSMSSSVIRRNEQLTTLDDRFEDLLAEYDDLEIGALDTEEIEGYVEPDKNILEKYINDFKSINKREDITPCQHSTIDNEVSSDEENFEYINVRPKAEWDCESIVSTYSNIYNHPKLIDAPPSKIKLNKHGIPINENKLTIGALKKHNVDCGVQQVTGPGTLASAVSILSIRDKEETPEERRDRKKAIKKYQREKRVEKKLDAKIYKQSILQMQAKLASANF